jgi:hypothetical protein
VSAVLRALDDGKKLVSTLCAGISSSFSPSNVIDTFSG